MLEPDRARRVEAPRRAPSRSSRPRGRRPRCSDERLEPAEAPSPEAVPDRHPRRKPLPEPVRRRSPPRPGPSTRPPRPDRRRDGSVDVAAGRTGAAPARAPSRDAAAGPAPACAATCRGRRAWTAAAARRRRRRFRRWRELDPRPRGAAVGRPGRGRDPGRRTGSRPPRERDAGPGGRRGRARPAPAPETVPAPAPVKRRPAREAAPAVAVPTAETGHTTPADPARVAPGRAYGVEVAVFLSESRAQTERERLAADRPAALPRRALRRRRSTPSSWAR